MRNLTDMAATVLLRALPTDKVIPLSVFIP